MSVPMSAELAPEIVAVQAAADAANGLLPDPTLLPAAEARAQNERANAWWNRDLPELAVAEDVTVPPDPGLGTGSIAARRLVPPGARPGVLLFVHGGGFAMCSPATHERCARVLALGTGLPVLLPDYRLAPEHPFPAGLTDVVAALRAAPAFAAASGPLAVTGDSAGANLALAALLHEIGLGRPSPASAALLFYGVFDADFETESYRVFSDGPGLTREKMRHYWDWYLADPDARRDPLASPLRASDAALAALPPVGLFAASVDPLLSDSLGLGTRLAALGRGGAVSIVPGVTHGFLQMSRDLPQAQAALSDAAAFIRTHI